MSIQTFNSWGTTSILPKTKASLTSGRTCFCVLSTVKNLAKSQGTHKGHARHTYRTCMDFWPADHTQTPAKKNWHAHYFLRVSCDFRFAVSPQGTCTKNLRYPCVLLVCHRFKMEGKRDLKTVTGPVLVPYFPFASQCMIPKHVRAECMKCTTAALEAHLARTTPESHARSNIQFRTVGERPTSWLHEPLAS